MDPISPLLSPEEMTAIVLSDERSLTFRLGVSNDVVALMCFRYGVVSASDEREDFNVSARSRIVEETFLASIATISIKPVDRIDESLDVAGQVVKPGTMDDLVLLQASKSMHPKPRSRLGPVLTQRHAWHQAATAIKIAWQR